MRALTSVNVGLGMIVAAFGLLAWTPGQAHAIPVLQIYVEGSTYDAATETWSLDTASLEGGTATIWVIGNLTGPGGRGEISDVTLIASYDDPGADAVSIGLTPTTTDGAGGMTDPSTPTSPTYVQTVSDGSTPDALSDHGVFGDGREWQEFSLGDFTLTDSTMADVIASFPSASLYPSSGQINAYEVSFSGIDGTIHFDAYGVTQEGTRHEAVRFAPYSHDGELTTTDVPELSAGATGRSALALLVGCAAIIATRRRPQA